MVSPSEGRSNQTFSSEIRVYSRHSREVFCTNRLSRERQRLLRHHWLALPFPSENDLCCPELTPFVCFVSFVVILPESLSLSAPHLVQRKSPRRISAPRGVCSVKKIFALFPSDSGKPIFRGETAVIDSSFPVLVQTLGVQFLVHSKSDGKFANDARILFDGAGSDSH
jgi:hypothetical protein